MSQSFDGQTPAMSGVRRTRLFSVANNGWRYADTESLDSVSTALRAVIFPELSFTMSRFCDSQNSAMSELPFYGEEFTAECDAQISSARRYANFNARIDRVNALLAGENPDVHSFRILPFYEEPDSVIDDDEQDVAQIISSLHYGDDTLVSNLDDDEDDDDYDETSDSVSRDRLIRFYGDSVTGLLLQAFPLLRPSRLFWYVSQWPSWSFEMFVNYIELHTGMSAVPTQGPDEVEIIDVTPEDISSSDVFNAFRNAGLGNVGRNVDVDRPLTPEWVLERDTVALMADQFPGISVHVLEQLVRTLSWRATVEQVSHFLGVPPAMDRIPDLVSDSGSDREIKFYARVVRNGDVPVDFSIPYAEPFIGPMEIPEVIEAELAPVAFDVDQFIEDIEINVNFRMCMYEVLEKVPCAPPHEIIVRQMLRANAPEFVPLTNFVPSFSDDEEEEDDNCSLFGENKTLDLPEYDPTVSMVEIAEKLEGWSPEDKVNFLKLKHYPEYLWRFVLPQAEGSLRRLKSIQARREPVYTERKERRNFVDPYVGNFAKGKKKTGNFWRIRVFKCKQIPKPAPADYSVARFKSWVYGEAYALRDRLRLMDDYVTGNDACFTLFHGCAAPVGGLRLLLDKACVFVENYNGHREMHKPPRPTVWEGVQHLMPKNVLYVLGHPVSDPDEFEMYEALFHRNKPLFDWGLAYLRGDAPGFDPVKWQRAVDNKICRQGQAMSVGLEVSPVRHQIEFVNLSESFRGLFSSESIPWNDSFGQTIAQLTTFLMNAASATSMYQFSLCVGQFVSGNSFLFKYCKDMVSFASGAILRQGLMDTVREYGSQICTALSTCMVVPILQTVANEFSSTILPAAVDFVSMAARKCKWYLTEDLLHHVYSIVKGVFLKLAECLRTRSFTPLWGDKWDPKAWMFEAEASMTHFIVRTTFGDAQNEVVLADLRNRKLVPVSWTTAVSPDCFLDDLEKLYVHGERVMGQFKSDSGVAISMSRVRTRLRSFIDTLTVARTGCNERLVPYALFLFGQAGTGKTYLMDEIYRAIGIRNGYDVTSAGKYSWQCNVNFQDGFNHTQWAVFMDDVDHGVAPPAAGTRTHIEDLLALVNSKSLPVEQSDVAMKGKVFARPLLVMQSSNFAVSHVNQLSRYPPAWHRRFKAHVTVAPKPEYACGQGMLDKAAAFSSLTHDMYVLEVRRFSEAKVDPTNTKGIPLSEPEVMSFPEFMKWLQQDYAEHISREQALLTRKISANAHCEVCGLPTNRSCGHEVVERQMFARAMNLFTLGAMPIAAVCSVVGLHQQVQARLLARAMHVQLAQDYDCIPPRTFEDDVRDVFEVFARAAGAGLICIGAGATIVECLKLVYQNRVANATDGLIPFGWLRANQEYKPGVPPASLNQGFTKDEIIADLQSCVVPVSSSQGSMYGVLLSHNTILIPTHLIAHPVGKTMNIDYGSTVEVHFPARKVAIQVTTFNSRVCSNVELLLVRCGSLMATTGLVKRFMPTIDRSIHMFSNVEVWTTSLLSKTSTNQVKSTPVGFDLFTDATTSSGDCGAVYLAQFNNVWHVCAIHYAVVMGTGQAMGAMVARDELERLFTQLSTVASPVVRYQGLISTSPVVEFGKYPVKSEVWAAHSHHGAQIFPFGEVFPPIAGMSNKTKIKRSLFYEEASEKWEERWCGQRPYWLLPDFRGRMVDDKWVSPYTNMFATQNLAVPDEEYLALSLIDYLSGIDDLSYTGYATLSEEQVLTGVMGSNIHAVNVRTSVGPPFNKSKQQFVALKRDDSHMAPEIWETVDYINGMLDEGVIPAAASICTLKDENLKPGKMPRVFNNMPFAYNFVLKQHFAPVKEFMRANPTFFESYVGTNMTSLDVNRVVEPLRQTDPTLQNVIARDARALDKSYNGVVYDYIAMAFYSMAFVLGFDAMRHHNLIMGLKNTTYIIKGDAFGVYNNPSGNDLTVEVNGVDISVGDRYVYYKQKFPNGLPSELKEYVRRYMASFFESPVPHDVPESVDYRKKNALATYGDDNLKTSLVPYDPSEVDIWREDLGLIMTDEKKADVITARPLTEVSFLKRSFVFDEELHSYIPPLDLKSIARMLLWKKDSVLSDRDHACVALSCAGRELAYHGVDLHLEFSTWAEQIVSKYGLSGNPYLDLREFSAWRAEMKAGSFQTWWNGDPVPHTLEEVPHDLIQRQMSNVSFEKAGNDPARSDDHTATSLNLVTPVTTISSDSSMIQNSVSVAPSFFQKMPQNELSDYLLRLTEIQEIEILDTDLSDVLLSFDPWELFLANAAIADKIANFAYIKGTIEVVFMIAVPGAAYGSYVVSALPDGYPSTVGPAVIASVTSSLIYENLMQVDHYARVDLAASENVVMQLPWIWPYDYATLPDGPAGMWSVKWSCLSPIRTSITGGQSLGSAKVYARLMPGYEIVVPHLQMKRKGHLVQSSATQMAHPALHKSLGKPSAVADKVGKVADVLSKVPIIGPYAQTASKVAHAASSFLSHFGFTRETAESHPVYVIGKSTSNVAQIDGVEPNFVAALEGGNEISIDPRMMGLDGQDDASFASLFQRWTLVSQFDWGSGDLVDQVLADIPVTPSFARNTGRTVNFTTAGYVGLPFQYWRGDMEYLVVIPVSKLHRGSLQALWLSEGSTLTGAVTNRTFNHIFDVTSGDEYAFRVGFAREQPYLENRPITAAVTIVPDGSTNGHIYFRVVNPLQCQDPSAVTTVSVFARAGVNMDFAVPRELVPYVDNPATGIHGFPLRNGITYQIGALGDEETNDVKMVDLVQSSGDFPSADLLFGEKISSARPLMQKFSTIKPLTADLADKVFKMPLLGMVPVGTSTSQFQNWWNWFGHYRILFVGIACSERFKCFCSSSSTLGGAARWINNGVGSDTISPSLWPSTLTPVSHYVWRAGECQVPYYGIQKYLKAYSLYPTTGDYNVSNVLWSADGSASNQVFYHAAGPDIRLANFRQVPRVIFANAPVAISGGSWFN